MKASFNSKGFSLIEVLIVMAFLSVAFMGTSALLIGIIRGNMVSKNITIATMLAQEKMEEIKARGYSGIPEKDTVITEDYGAIENYPTNNRELRILVDHPQPGVKTVTVESGWQSGPQPVVLESIIVR